MREECVHSGSKGVRLAITFDQKLNRKRKIIPSASDRTPLNLADLDTPGYDT